MKKVYAWYSATMLLGGLVLLLFGASALDGAVGVAGLAAGLKNAMYICGLFLAICGACLLWRHPECFRKGWENQADAPEYMKFSLRIWKVILVACILLPLLTLYLDNR